ncbi:MAG: iron-containing alcohol dehydrogenase [Gammaproteobacteria bacterium]|nr:iron-containing alcohol dehydrogenase [Gammaproteobacteria bacterium]MDD9894356.1 iron-containing alcohol dehydrogenase [Gammaproteobacteria bacterium]MDD9957676.1 iron-containing alcohol dehydrogenase [Gammaproteobacteria bacterium]
MEFNYSALETVVVGESVQNALPRLVEKLGAKRPFLVASSSLSRATNEFSELQSALDGNCVGLFDQIGSHTPREDVLKVLAAVRNTDADLLISLGGGSIIDASKAVQLAIDQEVETESQLLEYAQHSDGTRGAKWGNFSLFSEASKIRQIAVPTTLSGAEYSNNAGVLNTKSSTKEGYRGLDLCPQCIIYDPELSTYTPEWLWLSTAIRSLDHAVEGYCSKDSTPYLDAHFLQAMTLFADSLPVVKMNPQNREARSQNFQAVWLACCGLGTVPHGASHGIGYILGSYCGVPHGYTSCVMLPAVLEWNSSEFSGRQKNIAAALESAKSPASIAIRELISSLELPTALRDVGVKKEQLDEIAERAIKHPVVRRNPKELSKASQVREILELAW